MATYAGEPTDGEPGDGEALALPDEVIAEIRDSERRRALLAVLADSDGPVPLTDLARGVVARERGVSPDAIDGETVRAARDDIYERHLPKLTATEVVVFDSLVSTAELALEDERLLDGP